VIRQPALLMVAGFAMRRAGNGLAAATQRHYFSGPDATCTKVGTTLVTIVAGPLNDIGANPKVNCQPPQPSK
jgi:hypothetical protein